MARLVAFLRAINVGGHTVTMARLREIFEESGFGEVETFIASGNVLFTSKAKAGSSLQRRLEARLKDALGYEVATFVRTAQEVVAIARYPAFPEGLVRSAGAYCIGFLAEPLGAAATRSLSALKSGIDDFRTHGREVYWLCRKKQNESKFSNVVFERATGVRVTFRGANTVAKLAGKVGG